MSDSTDSTSLKLRRNESTQPTTVTTVILQYKLTDTGETCCPDLKELSARLRKA